MNDQETKARRYHELIPELESLISGETDETLVLANASALLKQAFPEEYFWVGFYRVVDGELLLGPFQGTVACMHIKRGRGVCGTAWERESTIVVPDVHQFPGHIACSSLSQSEIVVPVFNSKGVMVAELDIDSTELNTFDDTDKLYLEQVCEIISKTIYN